MCLADRRRHVRGRQDRNHESDHAASHPYRHRYGHRTGIGTGRDPTCVSSDCQVIHLWASGARGIELKVVHLWVTPPPASLPHGAETHQRWTQDGVRASMIRCARLGWVRWLEGKLAVVRWDDEESDDVPVGIVGDPPYPLPCFAVHGGVPD